MTSRYPWQIFLLTAAVSAAVIVYALAQETSKEMLSIGLVASIRTASVGFLFAFAAGPLLKLVSNDVTRFLRANRRYLGLSFAQLLGVHFCFVVAFLMANPGQTDIVTLIGGGLAFGLTFLQAGTSNDFSVSKLGAVWRWLHNFGMYYVWFILTLTFSGGGSITSMVFTGLFSAAMLIRLGVATRARFRKQSPA